jgi:hypothetical protein
LLFFLIFFLLEAHEAKYHRSPLEAREAKHLEEVEVVVVIQEQVQMVVVVIQEQVQMEFLFEQLLKLKVVQLLQLNLYDAPRAT